MGKQKKEDEDFFTFLQKEIRTMLNNSETTSSERIKAIEMGTKLELARHKIKGAETEGSFYDG